MEQPSQDPARMEMAFQAAVEIGIPIVNCGPGGKSNDKATLQQSINSLGSLAEMAEKYGVTLCVKAHVGASIYNTPTTLRAMAAITSPAFGIDMDPSPHLARQREPGRSHRGRRLPRQACPYPRLQRPPAKPRQARDQANGRGDIDLLGYLRVLHESGYTGPVDLEVIGAKDYTLISAPSSPPNPAATCRRACRRAGRGSGNSSCGQAPDRQSNRRTGGVGEHVPRKVLYEFRGAAG